MFNLKCASSLKKVLCLPVIANAKTVHKNLFVWQNQFLSTLKQFAVCRGDNQDHALIFDVLYWARNVKKKRVDEVRFMVPPDLPLVISRNSPLLVCFSSFLLPWLMLLYLFLKMFSSSYLFWHTTQPNYVFLIKIFNEMHVAQQRNFLFL